MRCRCGPGDRSRPATRAPPRSRRRSCPQGPGTATRSRGLRSSATSRRAAAPRSTRSGSCLRFRSRAGSDRACRGARHRERCHLAPRRSTRRRRQPGSRARPRGGRAACQRPDARGLRGRDGWSGARASARARPRAATCTWRRCASRDLIGVPHRSCEHHASRGGSWPVLDHSGRDRSPTDGTRLTATTSIPEHAVRCPSHV